MAKYQQRRSVAPPTKADKDLLDFTSVIQDNLQDLWELAHDHADLTGSSTEVTSLSKFGSTPLTGNVTLAGGSNVSLTQVGQQITITASDTDTGITQLTGDITAGPGNGSQVAAIAAGVIVDADINASAAIDASKIANGSVSNAEFQRLDGVTSGIQTQIDAKVPSTRTISTTAPLTGGGDLSADRTLVIPKAAASVDGYLDKTDFSTFNAKQPAGSYVTALTGDVTAAGPGSSAATLATVNLTTGSFTKANITVNGKGLVTAAASGAASVDSIAKSGSTALTGAVTLSGGTNVTLTQVGQNIAIASAATNSINRENYIVGTPSASYSGSTTVFTLTNTYTTGANMMEVYVDGDLQTIGATIDYVETSSTVVTFNNALVAGQKVAFIFSQPTATPSAVINSGTAGNVAYYATTGTALSEKAVTGSGSAVLATAPTLSAPILGAASATSLTFSSTAGIIGTTTNNNADAGSVGEILQSTLARASHTALSNGTSKDVTSVSLTAGQWMVYINAGFDGTGPTSQLQAAISTTTATLPGNGAACLPSSNQIQWSEASQSVATADCSITGCIPVKIASTTTFYLVVNASFASGSCNAYGSIIGVRAR